MASIPTLFGTPVIGEAALSAANTNRDGTGTIVSVITGASGGTKITMIEANCTVTNVAGTIRLYISDGTTTRLWRELPTTATTVSATQPGAHVEIATPHFVLPSGYILRASTEKAEAWNVHAFGGTA